MRTGTIIDSQVLPAAKGFVTFGRHKAADVLVEHPSASRMHAVLQFRGREAFLADCNSTHATFLNRQVLEPCKYYSVHVGAQFRLGQSTRSYIFVAPEVRPFVMKGECPISWCDQTGITVASLCE
jgi:pSer/pThr/pTyr-binding forkhead associated (FHA) protein